MLLYSYCYHLIGKKIFTNKGNGINRVVKIVFSILFVFLVHINCKAQTFLGYHSTSYAGVYGTLYNPANILDARVNSDINLIGFSIGAQNNVVALDLRSKEGTQFPNPIAKIGTLGFTTDILGPSFMKKISDEHAFAITTRARAQANFDNFPANLLNVSLQKNRGTFDFVSILVPKASAQVHAWNELAFTYSRQIANTDFGVWKAAVSVKLLGGQGAAYLNSNNLSFMYRDTMKIDTAAGLFYNGGQNFQGNINWKYSAIWDNDKSFSFFRQPGLGLDIGFTYEYRDEMQVYETNYNDKTLNYKWKFGASIMDIGSINYKTSSNSYNAKLTGQTYLFDSLKIPADSSKISQITNFYRTLFPGTDAQVSNLRMTLPTTLHLMFDYSFNEWLSTEAHFTMPIMLSDKSSYIGTYSPTILSVTPRAELPWCGIYTPISYNFLSGFQMGAAFRIGPLVVGSGSIITFGGLQKAKALDGYLILRIPFFKYKPYEKEYIPQKSKRFNRQQRRSLYCPTT